MIKKEKILNKIKNIPYCLKFSFILSIIVFIFLYFSIGPLRLKEKSFIIGVIYTTTIFIPFIGITESVPFLRIDLGTNVMLELVFILLIEIFVLGLLIQALKNKKNHLYFKLSLITIFILSYLLFYKVAFNNDSGGHLFSINITHKITSHHSLS